MGLFKKTPVHKQPAALPTIHVEGVPVHFDSRASTWSFTYRDVDFVAFQPTLTMPTASELDAMLATAAALTSNMQERLNSGFANHPDTTIDDGESWHIDLGPYDQGQAFEIAWADGASWGDMGISFRIERGAITDEAWVD